MFIKSLRCTTRHLGCLALTCGTGARSALARARRRQAQLLAEPRHAKPRERPWSRFDAQRMAESARLRERSTIHTRSANGCAHAMKKTHVCTVERLSDAASFSYMIFVPLDVLGTARRPRRNPFRRHRLRDQNMESRRTRDQRVHDRLFDDRLVPHACRQRVQCLADPERRLAERRPSAMDRGMATEKILGESRSVAMPRAASPVHSRVSRPGLKWQCTTTRRTAWWTTRRAAASSR